MPPLRLVAVNVILSPGQIEVVLADKSMVGVLREFTVMEKLLLVVVQEVSSDEVTVSVTLSPFFKLEVEKEVLFVPTSAPSIFHEYDKVPVPPLMVAEKVTGVPSQIVLPVSAEMLTDEGHACPHPNAEVSIRAQKVKTFKSSFFTISSSIKSRGTQPTPYEVV